jgi:predicted glycosyltransferase
MRIWIDLDNTPHVPFFRPIIRELESRGHVVTLTARDAFQVCDLAEKLGLKAKRVGRHYGKKSFMKIYGLAARSAQLLPIVLRDRPVLALSHGSRSQILLANLLRIPTVMVMDYEHASTPPMVRPKWEIVPKILAQENLHCRNPGRIRTYTGIKEDVYAPDFQPDPILRKELGILPNQILVTVRPPANEAHYYNPESTILFDAFMDRVTKETNVRSVMLPRNKSQEAQMRREKPHWFEGQKVVVPKQAVDGMNLLWHSDLVVSGGGTMNREAAALGVPVYSVFRGKIGAVDRELERQGRMTLIESKEQVTSRIAIKPRAAKGVQSANRAALTDILDHVEDILRQENLGVALSPVAKTT